MRVVSRNHTISNIIDGYLAQHPEKRRDKEELARLDAEDTLGNEPRMVKKRERDDGADLDPYEDSDDDGSGSDRSDYSALGFGGLNAGAVMAAMMRFAAHAPCPKCSRPVPHTDLVPPSSRRPSALPPRCLGNAYERGVLTDYLDSRGKDVAAFVEELYGQVGAGQLPMPTTEISGSPIEFASPSCQGCFDRAVGELAYAYRRAIPPADLPDAVVRREDCWYGLGCRTQHRPDGQHAARLNHICAPSRGASGKGGGRGRGGGGGRGGGNLPPPPPAPAAGSADGAHGGAVIVD